MESKHVVVNVCECYSDNNGAFDVVSYWDGESISALSFFAQDNKPAPSVNASFEQKKAAAEWYKANVQRPKSESFGHKFVVGGSRKIEKGAIVEMIDYQESYFNNKYYQHVDAKVLVECADGRREWISSNCLKSWAEGTYPYWFDNHTK